MASRQCPFLSEAPGVSKADYGPDREQKKIGEYYYLPQVE